MTKTIQDRLRDVGQELAVVRAQWFQAQERYKQQVRTIQADCPHEQTEYTPDASGNNDSSVDCVDCGAWLGRTPSQVQKLRERAGKS